MMLAQVGSKLISSAGKKKEGEGGEGGEGGSQGVAKDTLMQGGMGLISAIGAKKKEKEKQQLLDQSKVQAEDLAQMNMAKRRMRAFQTGTAGAAQTRALRSQEAQAAQNVFRAGGGAGATIRGLRMMTSTFQAARAKQIQQSQAMEARYADALERARKRVSQIKIESGQHRLAQVSAEAAQKRSAANQASALALAKAVPTSAGASGAPSMGGATGGATGGDTGGLEEEVTVTTGAAGS